MESVKWPSKRDHLLCASYATNKAGKTGYSDTLRFKAGIHWNRAANKSVNALITHYWNEQGYFNTDNRSDHTFQYYPQGQVMDILAAAYKRTNNNKYALYILKLYNGVLNVNGGLIREYYDDMQWYALGLLRAFKATGESKYKRAVTNILWPKIKGG